MKTSSFLLALSLAANAALAVGLALHFSATPVTTAGHAPAVAKITPAPSVAVPVANLWSRLHRENLDQFRDRLRAAGFPSKAVRGMLAMEIGDEQNSRREAFTGKTEDLPYWKYPNQFPLDRARQSQLHEIYEDSSELFYKYVNGPEFLAEDEDALALAKRRFGDLPLEKLQKLTALDHDFQAAQQRAFADDSFPGNAAAMQARGQKLQTMEAARMAEVAKILDPAELEAYELRNNARGLAASLEVFQPTEEEFKSIYRIQRQQTQLYAPPVDDAARAALVAERDRMQAQLAMVLGPARFEDFKMATGGAGSDLLPRLMLRLELPISTITTINGVRDDINSRAKSINENKQLGADERATQLAALAQEANDRLTTTLGQRGYEAYADMKGDWIRALKPKRPRPSGP